MDASLPYGDTTLHVSLPDCNVTVAEPPGVEECLMCARESIAEAIEPGSDVLMVPNALDTLLVAGE